MSVCCNVVSMLVSDGEELPQADRDVGAMDHQYQYHCVGASAERFNENQWIRLQDQPCQTPGMYACQVLIITHPISIGLIIPPSN